MRFLRVATVNPIRYTCSGCDRERWATPDAPARVDADTFPFLYYCRACAENNGRPRDPYADLPAVIAETGRLVNTPGFRVTRPKPSLDDYDDELLLTEGDENDLGNRLAKDTWHFDGDRRYE